jgi:SAM-dependent MidA family methyltransferase
MFQPSELSAELISILKAEAGAGAIPFSRFMELCLYHPRLGYYRRSQPRVGYAEGTDFLTSATSGPVFGELVSAACVSLLAGRDPSEFAFVEIGAEPETHGRRGVLAGVAHPFRSVEAVGIDETCPGDGRAAIGGAIPIEGKCIVFSNELFDAQPFHRFLFRAGAWREVGVAFAGNAPVEQELPPATPAYLPLSAPEGYRIDAPLHATRLLDSIASLPWNGLFVAFDYGKSWDELTQATPQGTARAYARHRQSNDLLARPGEQDLTCHVCWDWLAGSLSRHGFEGVTCESQESFFVHHASTWLKAEMSGTSSALDSRKRSLLQLIHPVHMGQAFQVLHASRNA